MYYYFVATYSIQCKDIYTYLVPTYYLDIVLYSVHSRVKPIFESLNSTKFFGASYTLIIIFCLIQDQIRVC